MGKRIFIVDGREMPDMLPDLSVDQVREQMTNFFPELVNATVSEKKRGDDTYYSFQKTVGRKGQM